MKIAIRLFSLTILVFVWHAYAVHAQTNYYWNGTDAVNLTTSWGTNLDGTGSTPANFTTANQLFNLQSGQSAALSGVWTISGSNSRLVVQGGASFTSGSNNPSMTVNLDSGSLYVMSHTTYSSLSFGTVDAASTFRLDNQSNPRVAGITYGNFVFNGTGNVSLTSALSVIGTLQVSNTGQLRLTNSANLTHAVENVLVDSSRTLVLVQGTGNMTMNLTGDFTNQGTLTKPGSGSASINFSGTGTSDATWGSHAISFDVSIQSGRTVTFLDTFNPSGGSLVNDGTLNIGNGGTSGAVSRNIENNGSVIFNRSDNITYSETISGSGTLTKTAGGTLTLDSANTYTGGTTVNGGTLLVANTLGSATGTGAVSVESGATLGGDNAGGGIEGAVTVADGANLAPGLGGATTGILQINNDVTLNSGTGTSFEIQVNGTGAGEFDQLLIGGSTDRTVSLDRELDITAFTPDDLTPVKIINNTTLGALNGTFSNYTNGALVGNIAGTDWFIWYGASADLYGGTGGNDVVLAPVPEPGLLLAAGLGALGVGGYIRRRFRRDVGASAASR